MRETKDKVTILNMTKEELREELKKSMLAKDSARTSTLRMLISAVGYFEIQKGGAGYAATDQDIASVIQSEAKKRRDSIEQFRSAGREEMAKNEEAELLVLQSFLPEQMGEDQVRETVKQAIDETGASGMGDMGKVMSNVMGKVRGQADGSLVSRLVREELS